METNNSWITLIPLIVSGIATILGAVGLTYRENNKKEIEVLEKANAFLDKKLDEQRVEILSIQSIKEDYIKQIAELRAENAILRDEIKDLRMSNELLTEQIKVMQMKLDKVSVV